MQTRRFTRYGLAAVLTAPAAAKPPGSNGLISFRRRPLALAILVLSITVMAVAAELIDGRSFERGFTNGNEAATAPSWMPLASPWLERVELISLKRQLVRAGYSIQVDTNLDPITKSALADYLRLDPGHPLSLFLGSALEGTVITGLRNPAAWNSHYGLHRRTKFVERPLTGPGGQLDPNGNYRPPSVLNR